MQPPMYKQNEPQTPVSPLGDPGESSNPTVPSQPVPKKPINTTRILLWLFTGLAALGLISNIARFGSRTDRLQKAAQRTKPSALNPQAVPDFEQSERDQLQRIEKENAEAQEALKKASQGLGPTLMPCTPALAGTQGTTPTGAPITCGTDGEWHPSEEAPGTPPLTGAQRAAMYGQQSGAGTHNDAAQLAKQRRLDALNSSSIAVDLTNKESGTGSTATTQQVAAAVPSLGAEEPHPIDLSKPQPEQNHSSTQGTTTPQPAKYDWDRYNGKLYRLFEGTVLETVLTNRINGALAGPINTMLTTDVFSHDRQQLLMPQGTRCFGDVSAVNGVHQQRLFVAFHRCIMPDGYSLDLDKFAGLNSIGETGLRDLVNHHYFSIFGASLAVGAIGGLAQIGNGTSGFSYDPSVSIRNGISQEISQESMQILDRFLNQLPTFIVRERSRVRIYLSSDLLMPAYAAHELDPTL